MMVVLSALIHLQFIKIVSKFPTIFIGREFVYFVYTTSVRGLGMDEFLLIFNYIHSFTNSKRYRAAHRILIPY